MSVITSEQLEKMQTSKIERGSYYSYFFGQNLFYMMVASFITLFLINQGINEALAAAILVVPQIFDVIKDVVFGVIVDKVRFKRGKFIPWLKMGWIGVPIATVFIFSMPESLSTSGKIVWVIVGYVVWSIAYTMSDTPIYALSTAMSEVVSERNSILSNGRLVGTIGTVVAMLGIQALYMDLGWSVLAIGLSIISMLVMFPILVTGRERRQVKVEKAPSVKEMFNALFKNKFLLVFYIAFFLVSITNTVQIVIPIFAQYVLGDTAQGTVMLAMSVLPALVVAVFIPALCKRIDKFYLYVGCLILFIVGSLIQYFTGYEHVVILYIIMALRGIGLVGYTVIVYLFTPDCIEYGHYKNGIRQEGVSFSIQTFITKLSAVALNALTLMLLARLGFAAQDANPITGIVGEQGAQASWSVFTWVSAIGPILAVIMLLTMYKLRDKDVKVMVQYNNNEITKEQCEASLSRKY